MPKFKKLYSDKKFTRLIHISDVHIRLYKRHKEYEQVFSKLYLDLEMWKQNNKNEETLIVLTGDLAHAKTDMSPEMLHLLSDFMTKLSEIYPVVVIAGNHDLNLANPHRLDALSPVINNLSNPNIHYLKESGIYPFGNIDFSVFSIIGSKDDWPIVSSSRKSAIKIGMYHGPIYRAVTDVGYVITSRNIDVAEFNGLDFVLLGDIHKFQVLQEFDDSSNKPLIAYAGSLIQQNHGESYKNHGWIEWKLDSKEIEFHEIRNNVGYVTLTLKSNEEIKIPNDFPNNLRLRLLCDNIDPTITKKFLTVIKNDYSISEVTINKISSLSMGESTAELENDIDIYDIDYQNSLIKTYLTTMFPGSSSEELLKKVCDINTEMNQKINEEDLPRNVHWKPLRLKFSNLFSYGVDNEINFGSMEGLYGVFSPNATGKTAAFEALCFALYDKTPRAFKGSHIMNTREDECFCLFDFMVGNQKYRISRTGARRSNGEVKIDVEFMMEDENGVWTYLSGEDRRSTNAIIRSYVGDYDDFVLTNLSVQNQNSLFIDKGQSERKDLLSQFMGLTVFDKLYELALIDAKEILTLLKQFNKEDFTSELAALQKEYLDVSKDHQTWTDIYKNCNSKIKNLNDVILELVQQKRPILQECDVTNIETLENKLQDITDAISHFDSLLKIDQKHVTDLKGEETKLYEKIDSFETEEWFEIELESRDRLKKFKEQLLSEFKELELHYNKNLEKVEWLKTHEYDPECTYCVNNIFVQDAYAAKENMESDKQKLADKQIHILETDAELLFYDKIYNDYEKLQDLTNKLNELKINIAEAELKQTKTAGRFNNLQTEKLDIEKSIFNFKQNQEDILFNTEIDNKIEKTKMDLKLVDEKYELASTNLKKFHGQMEVLKSKRDDLLDRIRKAEELESTYEAYEEYLSAVSRNGVPYTMISNIIPEIQLSVNNILNQIVDFNVALEVDGKNINGKIIYDDFRQWPLELASGMEKFVTGLAIRVALMSISNLPRSNFLIIDEGLGVLDSENLSSIFMLFDMLKTEFEFIILISHLDVVRDVADELIEIKRDDGYSYITI